MPISPRITWCSNFIKITFGVFMAKTNSRKKKNMAMWATALKVEQLGTLPAKYWMAAANQFWEIRTRLITSRPISGKAHQNFEVACAWQVCNPTMTAHYTVFKEILKQWCNVSLVKKISPQYLPLFSGITACCLDSLAFSSRLEVWETSKMSLNANTCSV